MSVTVTHQGRRAKIALGSAHVAVREVVARAKAHFGLEGSFGLRTTRGRRADVPDAAAWAHTGLSNNCELELVRRAGGGGGAVRVAAAVSHMGSAPRTVSFAVDAGTSLAAVVERLVAEGAAPPDPLRRAPTVRVMRDRFAGEDLGRTLGDLGYGGGAAVRLHVELGALADGAAPPEKRPRDEAAPAVAAAAAARPIVASPTEPSQPAAPQPPAAPPSAPPPPAPSPPLRDPLPDAVAGVAAAGSAGRDCAVVLLKYVEAVLRQPSLPRVRAIRAGNAAFAGRVAPAGGVAVLSALGFHEERRGGEPWLVLCDAGARDAARLTRALDMLRPLAAPGAPAPAFDPFATHRVDLRGGPAGPAAPAESEAERRARELRERAAALEGACAAPDREVRIVSAAAGARAAAARAAAAAPAADDMPRGDAGVVARAAAARERARRQADDAPLTTRAMRDVVALEKTRVYDRCVLRVEFPDRACLTARFHPREPCSAAYAVVAAAVRPGLVFSLFAAPPRRDLPRDGTASLLDLGLVPAARVFVSFAGGHRSSADVLSEASLRRMDCDAAEDAVPESLPVVPGGGCEAAGPLAAGGTGKKRGKPSWLKT